jgi:hypothetical protein
MMLYVFRDRWGTVDWPDTIRLESWWLLLFGLLLMPLNWGLETWKYRILLGEGVTADFRQLWRGVLSGVALSMTLPNRMGELGGRLICLPAAERAAGLSASLSGSALQLFWIGGGGLAVLITGKLPLAALRAGLPDSAYRFLPFLLLVIVLIMIRFLPAIRGLLAGAWTHFRKNLAFARVTKAAAAGLLRYGVFVLQYALLLRFCGAGVPAGELMYFAVLVFFFQTVLPLPPALGWFGRLQLALLVSGLTGIGASQAVGASLCLWTINLFLPGLVGAFFLFQNQREKTTRHEQVLRTVS